jgi:hypothetical protein
VSLKEAKRWATAKTSSPSTRLDTVVLCVFYERNTSGEYAVGGIDEKRATSTILRHEIKFKIFRRQHQYMNNQMHAIEFTAEIDCHCNH